MNKKMTHNEAVEFIQTALEWHNRKDRLLKEVLQDSANLLRIIERLMQHAPQMGYGEYLNESSRMRGYAVFNDKEVDWIRHVTGNLFESDALLKTKTEVPAYAENLTFKLGKYLTSEAIPRHITDNNKKKSFFRKHKQNRKYIATI